MSVLAFFFLHVPSTLLPAGILKQTHRLSLAGRRVKVDCYLPVGSNAIPAVVIAHGFSRNRRTMAGWGVMLAQNGMAAVVPDLPFWADHAANGRALGELLNHLREGELAQVDPERMALVGFSAGGFSSLLAAAADRKVNCWVGLDPVGTGGVARERASQLHIPCFVLRAEPAAWNAFGNAEAIFAALPGPAFSLLVNRATHVDAESPTSRAADWACGKSDPARREVFGQYLLACLQAGLLRNDSDWTGLRAATNDTRVRQVVWRIANAQP